MKIIIFGSVPPPIGGVTKSIQNLMNSLKKQSVAAELFTKKAITTRYDIAHIHYSKSWKRFVGLVLGKLMAKKVIFTLHGNSYKDDLFNSFSAKLSDGVILLNKTTESRYVNKFKKTTVLGSIFSEGVLEVVAHKQYFDRDNKKTYLLIYAYDKVYQDDKDIYGVDFILENLSSLDEKYVLVLLDPKGAYSKDITNKQLVYLDHEVDFLSLLSEIDIYVRPTTTDGSSVAVQEALLCGKQVLASDVVERPQEVVIYKSGDFDDFMEKCHNLKGSVSNFKPNSINEYIVFCNEMLEK